jgi:catechol 2,3-dioxygenase-like lactoylglutathione lyase family enzyme
MTLDHDKNTRSNYLNKDNLSHNSMGSNSTIKTWFLADAKKQLNTQMVTLPIQSFNHVSREVLNLQKSLDFYINILGFTEVPRPAFECEGHWLYGYGLALHLILTSRRQERIELLQKRLEHFTDCLPSVDHIAFVTDDLQRIETLLNHANVYYKKTSSDVIGIQQIFFFDPDGNVIELSNCGIPVGMTKCPIASRSTCDETLSLSDSSVKTITTTSSSSSSRDTNQSDYVS